MVRVAVFSRSQHCIDCGFLSYEPATPAAGADRRRGEVDPTPRCFRAAFDLAGEALQLVEHDSGRMPDDVAACDPASKQREAAAADEVVRRARQCPAFTRLRSGRSFEDHVELQRREGDRRWTLLAVLGGMIAGSALTLAATAVALLLT